MEIRLRGVLALCDRIHSLIHAAAQDNKGRVARQAHGHIVAAADEVRRLCLEAGASPADLPVRSRRGFQWLAFLAEEENFAQHLRTVATLVRLWRSMRHPTALVPKLAHGNVLFQVRNRQDKTAVTLGEGCIAAPEEVLAAALRWAVDPEDAAAVRLVRGFGDSQAYGEIWAAIEVLGGPPRLLRPAGRVYDLGRLFAAINAAYFENGLERPLLTWSPMGRSCFGRYNAVTDTVLISTRLDDAEVPEEVVAFVLYHELLHKALGSLRRNGRVLHHHPAFRQAERRFAGYQRINAFLHLFA